MRKKGTLGRKGIAIKTVGVDADVYTNYLVIQSQSLPSDLQSYYR